MTCTSSYGPISTRKACQSPLAMSEVIGTPGRSVRGTARTVSVYGQ